LTEQLLAEFGTQVASWTLIPAQGGVFEVELDDELVYSKKATGRHAAVEEIRAAIQTRLD
jgi:selenoprotein W-related protein